MIREVAARTPRLDIKCVQSAHSIDVVEAATSKRAVVETLGADCSGAILCIGDQGQEGGNDFELLASARPPSVLTDAPQTRPAAGTWVREGSEAHPSYAGTFGVFGMLVDGQDSGGVIDARRSR